MKHDASWVPPTLRGQRDHAASHSHTARVKIHGALLDRLGPADHPPGSPIRGGLRSLRTKLPSVRRHQRKAMAHATGRYPCAVLVAAGLAAALPARGRTERLVLCAPSRDLCVHLTAADRCSAFWP
jgi:hypothetical protein